jgi:hypothetical protein
MFQWLRRIWHFQDEKCFSYDVAISKEERKRRITEWMKLNGSVPAVRRVVGSRDGRTYPR